jgi:hypothetical protein
MHWDVWEYSNETRKKGYHIHHIDENPNNNSIDNLEEIEASKHLSDHAKAMHRDNPEWSADFRAKGIEAAKEWHKSNDGKKWHSEHAIKNNFGKQTYGTKDCKQCSKEFERGNVNAKFCSNKCKSQWRRLQGVDNEQRECTYCSKEFTANKYEKKQCCSKSCSAKHRWNERKSREGV